MRFSDYRIAGRSREDGLREETADYTDVVALDVEVREGDGDTVLRRRHDQPDAVLVGRVDARVERTGYRAVRSVDVASASVYTHSIRG